MADFATPWPAAGAAAAADSPDGVAAQPLAALLAAAAGAAYRTPLGPAPGALAGDYSLKSLSRAAAGWSSGGSSARASGAAAPPLPLRDDPLATLGGKENARA
jgi:hypothetical protein